jgi:hypothetical protein
MNVRDYLMRIHEILALTKPQRQEMASLSTNGLSNQHCFYPVPGVTLLFIPYWG